MLARFPATKLILNFFPHANFVIHTYILKDFISPVLNITFAHAGFDVYVRKVLFRSWGSHHYVALMLNQVCLREIRCCRHDIDWSKWLNISF